MKTMKFLLVFGFIITFVSAEQQVNRLDCSIKGPEYWCKNIDTAKKCRAVSYCEEYIWKKEKDSNDDNKCSYCQQFVGTLHMILMNKETRSQVVLALETACNLLPTSLKSMCTEMISLESGKIIDFALEHTKDPRKLCILIEMCANDSKPVGVDNFVLMKKAIEDKVLGDYCLPCKEYTSGLHAITSAKKTKTDLVNALKRMCKLAPKGVSALCPAVVSHLGPQMVDSMFNYTSDPSQFCAAVGLCMDRDRNTQRPKSMKSNVLRKPDYIRFSPEQPVKKSPNADICMYCKENTVLFHKFISSKKSQDMVYADLLFACSILQEGELKKNCMTIVTTYGKSLIIPMLVSFTADPNTFCKTIKLCSSGRSEAVFEKIITKMSPNGEVCEVCQQAIGTIHLLVSNKETQKAIISEITNACNYLPSSYQSYCEEFVNDHASVIIDAILKYTQDPRPLCQILHLCPQGNRVKKIEMRSPKDACFTCKVTVGTVHELLVGYNTTMMEGIQIICNFFQKQSSKNTCVESALILYHYIIKDTADPQKICDMLQLCSNTKMITNTNNKMMVLNNDHSVKTDNVMDVRGFPIPGIPCKTCESVLHTLYLSLKNNSAKEKVKNKMNSTCSLLSKPLQKKCLALLNNYFDEFWNIMVSELAASKQICQLLNCTSVTQQVLYRNGEICEYCVRGVTYVEAFLKCNKTKDYIINAADEVCGILPGELKEACKVFVSKYVVGALDCLIKHLKSPKDVCVDMHLCSASQNVPVFEVKGVVECEFCKYAAEGLGVFLQNKERQEEAMVVVLNICRHMPSSMEALCTSTIEQNFDTAIKFVIEKLEDSDDLCKDLRMCSSVGVIRKDKSEKVNGIECDICKYGAEGLGVLLNNKESQQEVKEAMLSICSLLPSSWGATCTGMVEENFDAIIKFLIVKLRSPEDLCEELGMCSSSGNIRKVKLVKVNGIECDFCKYGAEGLGVLLNSKESQQEVKEAMLNICSQLPSPLGATCTGLIEENFDAIIKFLIEKLNSPEDLCEELGMCSSSGAIRKEASVKVNGFVTCEVCELLMQKLDNMLKGNRTKDAVKDALDNLCADLPWSQQCTNLVEKYTDEIVNLLAYELKDTDKVCTTLGLCSSAVEISLQDDSQTNGKNDFGMTRMKNVNNELPTCNLCMFMSGKLDALLRKGAGKKMIKSVMKTVCSRSQLTKEKKEDCERLMIENKDMITKLVKSVKLPSLCKRIGHCISGHAVNTVPAYAVVHKLNNGGTSCVVCEYLIGVLDVKLSRKSVKSEIIAEVHKLCNKISQPILQTQCNALISEYGNEIIQLFVDNVLAPVDICQHFGLC